MILLRTLLDFPSAEYPNIKVKFNQWNGYDNPIEIYKNDPDKINVEWLFWRNKQRYFAVGQSVICLAYIGNDQWLLTTVKKITKELNIQEGINYEGDEYEQYRQYYGRVIVRFHKRDRTQCPYFGTVADLLEVSQILPDTFDDDFFPGYDKVRLSFSRLESILYRGKHDWIGALESQKAVYLITDTNNGKLYVGSATGLNGMLLQRWSNYISNGHGGNAELVALVKEKGFDYVKTYFQYSILDNYNSRVDDSVVLERESWWKETLLSRKFGYNKN